MRPWWSNYCAVVVDAALGVAAERGILPQNFSLAAVVVEQYLRPWVVLLAVYNPSLIWD